MSRKSSVPKSEYFHCKQCWKAGRQTSDGFENSLWRPIGSSGDFLVIGCHYCQNNNRRYTAQDVLRSARVRESDDFIRVWAFDRAPLLLRLLSPHGGDEDWVALLPPTMSVPFWMDSGSSFACCEATTHDVAGWTVVIGAHG